MITAISRVITNPTVVNIAQNADATVTCKTTVNAIGRPGFILIDNNIDKETKKFASVKEFLYQATCLGVYMALIVPVFKRGGFKLAKEKIFKNTQGFEHFKDFKEYSTYKKIADMATKNERLEAIGKLKDNNKLNQTLTAELKKDKPNKFGDIKGAVELSNIIGSVVGLAIVAPQISQALIHPAMRLIGLEKKDENKEKYKEENDDKKEIDDDD